MQRRRPRARRRTKGKVRPKTKVDKSLARRITRLEKQPEVKYLDFTTDSAVTTTGTTLSLISHMDDGPDYNERIGDKIISKRVYLQYRLVVDTAAAWQVRVICGWDKQTDAGLAYSLFTGTSPLTTELSTALLDNRAGMVTMNAPYNQNTKDRYKILYDKVHNINPPDLDVGSYVINVKKMINLNNAVVQYSAGVQTIDALPSRNLFVAYYYSLSAVDVIQMNLTSRFFYIDP